MEDVENVDDGAQQVLLQGAGAREALHELRQELEVVLPRQVPASAHTAAHALSNMGMLLVCEQSTSMNVQKLVWFSTSSNTAVSLAAGKLCYARVP